MQNLVKQSIYQDAKSKLQCDISQYGLWIGIYLNYSLDKFKTVGLVEFIPDVLNDHFLAILTRNADKP